MAVISNLIARLRADTASFDRKMNQSRRQMSSFSKGIKTMGRQMLAFAGVGGGLYAVKRGLESIVKAAMEQEKAERALTAAVNGSIGQFKTYAAEMQKLTIYGDEQILNQMAYAKNLGVTTGKLQEATTAAVGLAARYRLDLASAMMLVGRASQGQTQMLTRYGIVLDENLTDGQKFNEVLKIGVKSFRLAEEEARDAAGSFGQWKNEVGDFAEIIGGPLADALAKNAREQTEFMRKNKSRFERWTSDMGEGIEMVKKFDLAVLDSYKTVYQYSPWGLLYKGYKKVTKPESIAKPQAPISEDELYALKILKSEEHWISELQKTVKKEDEQLKAMEGIRAKYIPAIRNEIDLTGRLGEAREHARQMMKLENDLKTKALDKTKYGIALMKEQKTLLKELERSQRLARIADDIGESFANAFEDMIFEAKKFEDVMKSVSRSIARSVMQNLIFQPLGLQISGMIGGMFGKGTVGAKMDAIAEPAYYGHKGISPDFVPRLHTGLRSDEFPAIIQRGETIIPKADGGRNGKIEVHIHNEGQPLELKETPRWDGESLILNVVNKAIDHDISFRRKISSIR